MDSIPNVNSNAMTGSSHSSFIDWNEPIAAPPPLPDIDSSLTSSDWDRPQFTPIDGASFDIAAESFEFNGGSWSTVGSQSSSESPSFPAESSMFHDSPAFPEDPLFWQGSLELTPDRFSTPFDEGVGPDWFLPLDTLPESDALTRPDGAFNDVYLKPLIRPTPATLPELIDASSVTLPGSLTQTPMSSLIEIQDPGRVDSVGAGLTQRMVNDGFRIGFNRHMNELSALAENLQLRASINRPLLDSLTTQVKYNLNNPALSTAERTALLRQHKQVKQIVEGAEESLRGINDRIAIHKQMGGLISTGLSVLNAGTATYGLHATEVRRDELLARGDTRGAWRESLGGAGRFIGDTLGAIPTRLSFGTSVALGTALSEGGAQLGERAADASFDFINRAVHELAAQPWWPQHIQPRTPLNQ